MPVIYKTPTSVSGLATPTSDPAILWSNKTNVFTTNNQSTTALINSPSTSQSEYLYCNDFGFDIPNGSVINGIEVRVNKFASGNITDGLVRLVINGSLFTTSKSKVGFWPTSSTAFTYGSSFDTWSTSWNLTQINSTDFGVLFAVNGFGNSLASIDSIDIGIYYTTYASTFKTTWDTNLGSGPNQIRLPLVPGGTYDFSVNWGDGSSENITSYYQPEVTHTYGSPGTKTIEITGSIRGWSFYETPDDKLKITNVEQWGPLELTNLEDCFNGCENMTITAGDSFPVDAGYGRTSMRRTFKGCSSLTSFPIINSKGITNFEETWSGCESLTSFPSIDTSDGTNFTSTWNDCFDLTSFPTLDFSNGVNFEQTWRDCRSLTSFPTLDLSSGTNFTATWMGCYGLTSFPLLDVSNGTNFYNTWNTCLSLTSFPPLDLSNGTNFFSTWDQCESLITFPLVDVSSGIIFERSWADCSSLVNFPLLELNNGTTFRSAFNGCSDLTELPVGFGLKLSSLTIGQFMFAGTTLNSSAYSRLLQELATLGGLSYVTFHGGNAKYFKYALSSREFLVSQNWTITDGGLITETYSITSSGGAKSSGNAILFAAVYDQIVSGGMTTSGSSNNIYDETSEGGVVLSGAAEEINLIFNFENSVPVLVGGTSLIDVIYQEENSAGCVMSGTADVSLVIPIEGGSLLGGSSDFLFEYNASTDETGGVIASGSADISNNSDIIAEGGAVVGGDSDESAQFIYEGDSSGGIIASSSAESTYNENIIIEGGVIASGISDVDSNETFVTSGGAIAGGITLVSYENIDATGGIILGGYSIEAQISTIDGTGGVFVSGSSSQNIITVIEGGNLCSGNADVEFIYNETPTGGNIAGGSVVDQSSYTIEPIGGTMISGSSEIGINISVGGGVRTGGTLIKNIITNPIASGGVMTSGIGGQTFFDNFYGSGGVVGSGRATADRIKFFQKYKTGYCRAMASYNICQTVESNEKLIRPPGDAEGVLDPDRIRIEILPTWCELGDQLRPYDKTFNTFQFDCDAGLAKVVKNRQRGMVPQKSGRQTARDRGIAQSD